MRMIHPSQISFRHSCLVKATATKFIMPFPALPDENCEALVYPAHHNKAGAPVLDRHGKPIGNQGMIFYNHVDRSWQACPNTGDGVVIINQVPETSFDVISRILKLNPAPAKRWSVLDFKIALGLINQLGFGDMYHSSVGRLPTDMESVRVLDDFDHSTYKAGIYRRTGEQLYPALFVGGSFVFQGSAATEQYFPNGAVMIFQGEGARGIQPDVFVSTYVYANGESISDPERELPNFSVATSG